MGDGEAATDKRIWLVSGEMGQAVHVLDRFHITAYFSKAHDEVRTGEVKELKAKGYEPVLTKRRWLLPKEEFQFFWDFVSPYWVGQFPDKRSTK